MKDIFDEILVGLEARRELDRKHPGMMAVGSSARMILLPQPLETEDWESKRDSMRFGQPVARPVEADPVNTLWGRVERGEL